MSNKYTPRRISATYQVIIIGGFIILFLQLYTHATSMYRDSQSSEQVDRFQETNKQIEDDIRSKQITAFTLTLPTVAERDAKLNGPEKFLDEKVMVVNDSDAMAHDTIKLPSEQDVFKEPVSLDFIAGDNAKLDALKKKPKIDQWKWVLFKLE